MKNRWIMNHAKMNNKCKTRGKQERRHKDREEMVKTKKKQIYHEISKPLEKFETAEIETCKS